MEKVGKRRPEQLWACREGGEVWAGACHKARDAERLPGCRSHRPLVADAVTGATRCGPVFLTSFPLSLGKAPCSAGPCLGSEASFVFVCSVALWFTQGW